ncbi:MAG: 7TM diverse intracellular signaling domain-containing protein [Polyangiaceae bacterium]
MQRDAVGRTRARRSERRDWRTTWRRGFAAIACLSILCLGVVIARAAPIDPAPNDGLELGALVEHALDEQQSWSIDEAASPAHDAEFSRGTASRPSYGHTNAAHWYRAEVARSRSGEAHLLQVGFAELDDVTLFVRHGEGWRSVATGDSRPASTRDVAYPSFVFRLPETRAGPVQFYLRVASKGSVQVPLRLWTANGFRAQSERAQLGFGAYYGLLLALGLYNLFVFSVVRERTYLFYVGYLVTWVLFIASYEGHTTLHLWPDSPAWAQVAPGTFLCLSFASTTEFMRRAANIPVTVPWANRLYLGVSYAYLGHLLLIWIAYDLGVRVLAVTGLLTFLAGPVPVYIAWRGGYRPARFLLLWYVVMFPGGILLGVADLQWIPKSFVTEHAVKLGTALEALFFSFALADRIRLLQAQRAAAQQTLLEAERDALAAQRRFGVQLIAAQDAERERIARELHDGFGQTLSFIVGRLKRVARGASEESKASLEELAGVSQDATEELRAIAHHLHPGQLRRLGLASALEELADALRASQDVDILLDLGELTAALPPESELHIYRIAQEALSNAVKHASAKQISLSLRELAAGDGKMLALRVDDDGSGFHKEFESGLGLESMRERARVLGATLELDSNSRFGHGARMSLCVPIDRMQHGAP